LEASRLKMVEVSVEERERLERLLQCQQVAGMSGFERHLTQQALEVLHAAHRPTKLFPLDSRVQELLHHLQPRFQLEAVKSWAEHPGLQLVRAQRGHALVQYSQ